MFGVRAFSVQVTSKEITKMSEADKAATKYAAEQEMPPGLDPRYHILIQGMLRNAFIQGATFGIARATQIIKEAKI